MGRKYGYYLSEILVLKVMGAADIKVSFWFI
jgi:hypothetical protein